VGEGQRKHLDGGCKGSIEEKNSWTDPSIIRQFFCFSNLLEEIKNSLIAPSLTPPPPLGTPKDRLPIFSSLKRLFWSEKDRTLTLPSWNEDREKMAC
jgi:hypothetical protein